MIDNSELPRTNYLLECHLAPEFIDQYLYDLEPSRALHQMVLFAFSFDIQAVSNGRDQIIAERSFQEALRQLAPSYRTQLSGIELNKVQVRDGSVIVALLVSAPGIITAIGVAAWKPATAWIADKAVGGAFNRLGEIFVDRFISNLSRNHGQSPQELRVSAIDNIEKRALAKAQSLAHEHGCSAVSMSGGIGKDGWYSYRYKLIGCSSRAITIRVHGLNEEPINYQVEV